MIVIVYFLLLAVAFFFLIVRPQRRQLAARRALVAAIEVGDEVITAGGLYGVVVSAAGETLEIEVASGVVLTIAREAIARRRDDGTEAAAPSPADPEQDITGDPPASED
ncbi:MAG: preprotein translocase subunit YajC [Acidimicrobiia bacterium]|nr:preprotein translocase subunit YajC [Acidimicrobiia bacterium]